MVQFTLPLTVALVLSLPNPFAVPGTERSSLLHSAVTPATVAPLTLKLGFIELTILSKQLPQIPDTPPDNRTRPGGGLSVPDNSQQEICPTSEHSPQALIPVENPILTTASHPTFLIYVPYHRDDVQFGEFSILLWPSEEQRLYRVQFALPETPGVVSITLPDVPDHALVEDQYYRWYFQLYCRNGDGRNPDLTVDGMIRRVALTSEREQQIQAATPDIWYDAIALTANQLSVNPTDPTARRNWDTLLQAIDASHLTQVPIIGSVHPIDTPGN